MADLAAVPPVQFPRLRFRFAPGTQMLRLRWNVPQAWRALQEGTILEPPQRLPAGIDCLVWRREERVYFRTLPPNEAALLKIYRASTDAQEKQTVLRHLTIIGGDAALEAIDAALQGKAP